MTSPKLGLFSRFFALFGITTILLGFCMAAAYVVSSEQKAIDTVKERHDSLVTLLSDIENKGYAEEDIQRYAEEVKGHVLVKIDGVRYTSDDDFPEITTLLEDALQIEELYFAKYRSGYYLLYPLENGWVSVTSRPINLIIYPFWAVSWPWILALMIIMGSYLILRKWLKPVVDSVATVKKISTGDFSQRIAQHPNNELAELTRGIDKMAQDIKTMFDAKNELLLAISHELRTPLARMQISLAMMENNQYSEDIRQDLTQMDTLIEQLLEGERLQAGHKALHINKVYIPTLIEEVLSENNDFRSITLSDALPEVVMKIDVGRIKFLLRNLISNALKHNALDTQINLLVHEENGRLFITIQDNGTGIPEEAIPHLFEPFYCVENAQHRDTKGTGLGLYLCKNIALAHGGDIEVESISGKGSTFALYLPFANQ